MRTLLKTCGLGARTVRKVVSRPGEAWLLCRMAWWVTVLSVAARWFSLPRALAIVAGNERAVAGNERAIARNQRAVGANNIVAVSEQDPAVQERLARAIDLLLSADVLHFKPICWKRAAVLHRYLLRNGISTRIVFGVRNEPGGKVDGHAWLEAAGEPILESTPPEYVVTYRFPSTARHSHASHPAAEPLREPSRDLHEPSRDLREPSRDLHEPSADLFTATPPRSGRSGSCQSAESPTRNER